LNYSFKINNLISKPLPMKKIFFTIGVASFMSFSASVMSQSTYTIVNKIHVEGDTGWDYLFSDDQTGTLYVSHGTIVQVVDESKGAVIATITGLNGVHGIAVAPALNKGFITSGRDSSVVIFDTKTFQVITKVTVTGKGPDALVFDPFSNRVFVFNGRTSNATVIDAKSNNIVATIPLTGKPEFSAADGKGKVYVNYEDKSCIARINTSNNTVEQVWPIAPGEGPSGLAIDNETHRLFSVCGNKMMIVMDAETGKVITTLPTGAHTDGAAFDRGLKRAYSANGEGTLTVVQEGAGDTFNVLVNVPTQKGARTIAVNSITHHIYLPTADFEPQVGQERPKIIPGSFVVLDIVEK
jgi:DNA-binding beta-propeller fold protein YncE